MAPFDWFALIALVIIGATLVVVMIAAGVLALSAYRTVQQIRQQVAPIVEQGRRLADTGNLLTRNVQRAARDVASEAAMVRGEIRQEAQHVAWLYHAVIFAPMMATLRGRLLGLLRSAWATRRAPQPAAQRHPARAEKTLVLELEEPSVIIGAEESQRRAA